MGRIPIVNTKGLFSTLVFTKTPPDRVLPITLSTTRSPTSSTSPSPTTMSLKRTPDGNATTDAGPCWARSEAAPGWLPPGPMSVEKALNAESTIMLLNPTSCANAWPWRLTTAAAATAAARPARRLHLQACRSILLELELVWRGCALLECSVSFCVSRAGSLVEQHRHRAQLLAPRSVCIRPMHLLTLFHFRRDCMCAYDPRWMESMYKEDEGPSGTRARN
mmetsp:Transcript_41287/g.78927  ORF Transcript_41287/g.78927 Transcript_41287/m.78927 type:complete len:221 (+) Transcript_41287:494-1156(+)